MRKLLTLLLALTMCVCLVNLNNNHTKAEGEEPVEEPQQTEVAAPVQAVQAGVAAGVAVGEPSNELHISTLSHLEYLFNDPNVGDNGSGILDNDIVIDNDSEYSTFSLQVLGNRTLDLNGHNIIIKKTMLFEAPDTTGRTVKIINSDDNNDSVIKRASGANIAALVATRSVSGDKAFTLEIGDTANGASGKIVFDGKNKAIVGLGVGLNWNLQEELVAPGAQDTVVVKNTEFKNFKPSGSSLGIAVVNVGADLDLIDVNISNASLGISTNDVAGTGNVTPSETDLTSVTIENCIAGIMDGVSDGLNANNVKTNVLALQGTTIKNCRTGIRFVYPSPEADGQTVEPYLMFQGGNNVVGNTTNVDLVGAINSEEYISFSTPGQSQTSTNNVKFYLNKKLTDNNRFAIYKSDKIDDALLENTNYLLKIEKQTAQGDTGDTYIAYVVKPKPGDEGSVKAETSTTVSKGSKVIFDAQINNSATNVKLYDSQDNEVTATIVDAPTNAECKTVRVTFVPQSAGAYRVGYEVSDTRVYTQAITVSFPSPDPGKKDESCEKVIGPTWHWNNDKGICEDYGVVGTSTR